MLEILLFIVGIVSGFINVMAGGGSFLTIPLLIFMGLPPTVANGTNRLGVFLQSLFAVKKFNQYKVFNLNFALAVSIPATIGAIFGAYLATIISDTAFKKYLAIIMIVITFISILSPVRNLQSRNIEYSLSRKIVIFIVFTLIGIYGGFVQAGVGFLILAGISLTGFNLVEGNAIKTFVIMVFTVFALVIFILNNKVDFILGIILGIGNIIGALLGTKVTVEKGHNFIQKVVLVCIIIFALKLLLS
ncbi:sulfite exporter TauE/SafE family protein [Deferribacter abyssi]|uniref:sulfite exporter TauE/SafE family protein n=1 Tax=Deferribacter abyssi TaxID=213806 RepID=UPI003C15C9D8